MAKGKYQEWLEPDGLLKLEAWARNGLTDADISHNMGISVTTLYCYKNDFPPISDALKRGKEVVDILVENALFNRAIGYSFDEKKEEYESGVLTKRTVTTKHVSPDTTAQIFWLKNRKPNDWRDKRVIDSIDGIEKLDEILDSIKGKSESEVTVTNEIEEDINEVDNKDVN